MTRINCNIYNYVGDNNIISAKWQVILITAIFLTLILFWNFDFVLTTEPLYSDGKITCYMTICYAGNYTSIVEIYNSAIISDITSSKK